jgi:hypothetical protein
VRTIFPIFPINPLVKSAKITPCFRLGDLQKSGLQELLRACEDRFSGKSDGPPEKNIEVPTVGQEMPWRNFIDANWDPK